MTDEKTDQGVEIHQPSLAQVHQKEPGGPHLVPDPSPAAIVMEAVRRNPTPEVLSQLLAVQREWDAMNAKKAYVEAMALFKAECPPIVAKTRKASFPTKKGQAEYTWAPIEQLVDHVTPYLSKHGLSLAWRESQGEKGIVRVTCIVSHEQGHSEEYPLAAPRAENSLLSPAQNVMVTVTTLRRYTLLGALGLATAEMEDLDGMPRAPKTPRRKPSKEQLEYLKQAATQVDDNLRKKIAQAIKHAERGQAVNLNGLCDEVAAVLEPPAEREPGQDG